MKLTFLGTRGEIELRTRRHFRHSSLAVSYRGREVLVDCGLDWLDELERLRPAAIVVTHAHPDHAGGLRRGVGCPVFATEDAWKAMSRYEIPDRVVLSAREQIEIRGIQFEAFPVEHSLRAPAVAFRIGAGRATAFYAPDVLSIPDRADALAGSDLYVGDGASITRSIVRRRDGKLIGHASIRDQLDWCAEADLQRAVFTHCGSQILRDEEAAASRIEALGRERGIEAVIAADRMEVRL